MIYRRLDEDGDYVLGQARSEFLEGSEAVAQAVITWLKLLFGEWWENVNEGFPLFQSVLGQPESEVNLASVDNIVRARILSTQLNGQKLVYSIDSYTRDYNITTRTYSFEATITTIFSESVTISEDISLG